RISSVIAVLVGCSETNPNNPGPGPDAGPPPPPTCEGDPCGLPGQSDCCMGTTCINFHDFGSSQCVQECKGDTDCDSGCCAPTPDGKRGCSPKEWCGTAGIYPEALCLDADNCGVFNNQSQCVSFFETCLKALDQNSLTQWFSAVDACEREFPSSCSGRFGCL